MLMAKKISDAEYFASDEFKKRAEAQSRQSFEIISGPQAKQIHENYLKNQKKSAKGGK